MVEPKPFFKGGQIKFIKKKIKFKELYIYIYIYIFFFNYEKRGKYAMVGRICLAFTTMLKYNFKIIIIII